MIERLDTSLDKGPFAPPRPSMRGRYLIRNPLKAAVTALVDGVLAFFAPPRRAPIPDAPARILVANWGHLGDVVITFGAITALRKRFPGARIGMITSSWGKAAAATSGLVDDFHIVDHYALNRMPLSRLSKWKRYRLSRAKALREIRNAGYELAIDFYPFVPPAHRLFHAAGIPARIGFSSNGFGPLLTHAVNWPDEEKPIADHYRALLEVLEPASPYPADSFRPHIPADLAPPLPASLSGTPHGFILLHPGAGASYKDWGFDNWLSLIDQLFGSPQLGRYTLAVTGAGPAEVATAQALADAFPRIINLAGAATWAEFTGIVARAELVICPDTAAGHLAALFNRPVVSIFTGANRAAQWAPYTARGITLVQDLACAPCNRPGCEVMACIRRTAPAAVLAAARTLVEPTDLSAQR